MSVYVSQGHERGIGLEVFFKTILVLSDEELSQIHLIAFSKSVELTLKSLHIPYTLGKSHIEICGRNLKAEWQKKIDHSESHTCLVRALKLAEKNGVLFTLPTSKDQFKSAAGHTEYFRKIYRTPELGMFFSSPDLQVLLLTDHTSIKELPDVLSEEMIYRKLAHNLSVLNSWQWPLARILVSGLNPHAGENGMIGTEDKRIKAAIERLLHKNKFTVEGPYPGDTMLLEKKSRSDLLVYLFHDQGLGVFKGLQGFIGSNITLGLPYPRVSPDHGTSFTLFGKNQADYRGCAFALREAITLHRRMSHGKNSGHQGPRS